MRWDHQHSGHPMKTQYHLFWAFYYFCSLFGHVYTSVHGILGAGRGGTASVVETICVVVQAVRTRCSADGNGYIYLFFSG